MKITVDITEDEISILESCINVSENEGYEEDDAWEITRKLRVAVQQGVHPTVLTARHKLVSCPQCLLVFGIDLPAPPCG